MDGRQRCPALKRKIVLVDLTRHDCVVGYNVLRQRDQASRSVVVDALVEAIAHVWGAADTLATPLFARWASNLLSLLYQNKLTLAEAATLLHDLPLRQTLAGALDADSMAHRDWQVADGLNARDFENQVGSTVNRLRTFVENEHLKAMFGQTEDSFDFRRAIDEGWIVLVNLSTEGGRLSDANAKLFGRLLLSDLWTTFKERGKPVDARRVKPFYLYIDEFQEFITPTLAANLDQARGYGLHLTMSHQYPSQLTDEGPNGARLLHSIMGNVPSKVVFRTQIAEDLQQLAQALFMGAMSPDKVKLELYSTKVMGYQEVERESHTSTTSSTTGSGSSLGAGTSRATIQPIDLPEDDKQKVGRLTEGESGSSGENSFDTSGDSSSTTTMTTLEPVMGKELSHVQYASLEEQQFQAMQTLHSQDERECVVRLPGMKVPASLRTLDVRPVPERPKQVSAFTDACNAKWPFILPAGEAQRRLAHRKAVLSQDLKTTPAAEEPVTAARRRPKK